MVWACGLPSIMRLRCLQLLRSSAQNVRFPLPNRPPQSACACYCLLLLRFLAIATLLQCSSNAPGRCDCGPGLCSCCFLATATLLAPSNAPGPLQLLLPHHSNAPAALLDAATAERDSSGRPGGV